MEIPIRLARGERQKIFFTYLSAAFSSRGSRGAGVAHFESDGSVRSSFSGLFEVGENSAHLKWTIIKDHDYNLEKMVIESVDQKIPDSIWVPEVHQFVTSVLASAFADVKKKFFSRTIFYYNGPHLDGEYWLPGFRFAPLLPNDEFPYLSNAERVVCIDENISAVDGHHAFQLGEMAASKHAARLSLLLNIGLYRREQTQRWVMPFRADGTFADESIRVHLGFNSSEPSPVAMPRKRSLCHLGKGQGSLASIYRGTELVSLPPEARRILKSLDSMSDSIREAFDGGARLYQVAAVCGRTFPSVGLAYRVGAVEAVAKAAASRDKSAATRNFSEFMRLHVKPRANLEYLLNYMYGSARSGHIHSGEFPLGEFAASPLISDPFIDMEDAQRGAIHRACYELTREAIVTWILSLVPELSDEKSGC